MSPRTRTAPTLSERITGLATATDIAEGRLDAAVVQQARHTLDRAGQRRALSADHTVVGFFGATGSGKSLSLIHISEPTRLYPKSRMPSSA